LKKRYTRNYLNSDRYSLMYSNLTLISKISSDSSASKTQKMPKGPWNILKENKISSLNKKYGVKPDQILKKKENLDTIRDTSTSKILKWMSQKKDSEKSYQWNHKSYPSNSDNPKAKNCQKDITPNLPLLF